MSFWDKVKEFVGVEEDYIDDEFYDDYGDLEESDYTVDEYEKFAKVTEVEEPVKNDRREAKENKDKTTKKYNEFKFSDNKKSDDSEPEIKKEERNPRRSSQAANRTSANTKMFVTIREPLTYEDAKTVLDDVLDGKTVVLNLEMLEQDKKTQIFYFVSGGVYSVEGTIQNVTKDIYVLAPKGVEIDGKLKAEISNRNLYQI